MIARVVDVRERELYARVQRVSPARFAITFETGATIEADAHEGVQGLVVEDLPALRRDAARMLRDGGRVRRAQRRRERHEGQGNQEHQGDQVAHGPNVRPGGAEGVSL